MGRSYKPNYHSRDNGEYRDVWNYSTGENHREYTTNDGYTYQVGIDSKQYYDAERSRWEDVPEGYTAYGLSGNSGANARSIYNSTRTAEANKKADEERRKLEEETKRKAEEKKKADAKQKLIDGNHVNYVGSTNRQSGLFDQPQVRSQQNAQEQQQNNSTTSNDMTSNNSWSTAKEKSQNFKNTGTTTGSNIVERGMGKDWYGSVTADNVKKYGGYSGWQDYYSDPKNQPKSGGNSQAINQDADVDNRMQNNFYDNTFGAGASVGNNNSVNIIDQGGDGLDNMQSVAAYKGLNNNDYERSYGRMNGYGRSAGASEEAEKTLGVRNRVSNLYNMSGLTQKYWNNKSLAHQADYLGDIWKEGGFQYQMPGTASKLEDKTEEIANGLDLKKD